MRTTLLAITLTLLTLAAVADDKAGNKATNSPAQPAEQKQAEQKPVDSKQELTRLQTYVGQWRGVGQPKRGSAQGAWSEEADWAWDFTGKAPALKFLTRQSKYFADGRIEAAGENRYRLTVTTLADPPEKVIFSGPLENGRLRLVAEKEVEDLPARISVRQVAGGDRLLVLLERRAGARRFLRLAEVGYTRKGSGFGKGTNIVECIVTGGKGTIPVTHNGKTYYVCCSGCRDYFNENPEEVLAEYKARKEEEAKDAKDKGAAAAKDS